MTAVAIAAFVLPHFRLLSALCVRVRDDRHDNVTDLAGIEDAVACAITNIEDIVVLALSVHVSDGENVGLQ